jgi:hypothetical protein
MITKKLKNAETRTILSVPTFMFACIWQLKMWFYVRVTLLSVKFLNTNRHSRNQTILITTFVDARSVAHASRRYSYALSPTRYYPLPATQTF